VNTSSDIQVLGNLVRGNRNGIAIQSRTRGDGPRGRYVLRDVSVEGNQVVMDKQTARTGVVENKDSAVRQRGLPPQQLTDRDRAAETLRLQGRDDDLAAVAGCRLRHRQPQQLAHTSRFRA
jgi:hypothetical protein